MPHSPRVAARLLFVFSKEPRPGSVKTRMCPPLSAEQAARCHTAFLGDLLARGKGASVQGTFNAAAAQGLAASAGMAERTAKATEQTAKNTKRLVDAATTGGLAFT